VITALNEDSMGIAEIENADDEIKAILEWGIDNLGVSGQKLAILGWERDGICHKTKLELKTDINQNHNEVSSLLRLKM
jgi:hypothetical protein